MSLKEEIWRCSQLGRVLEAYGPIRTDAAGKGCFCLVFFTSPEGEEFFCLPWLPVQAGQGQGRKGGEDNAPATGLGHFWMSRSSGCGRGAGVQASLERLRLGVCAIWGKVRRDFLGERNASFLLHICLLFFQFATKSHQIAQDLAARTAQEQLTNHRKHLPSSLSASRYLSIRNRFNPPLGDKTPAPSRCWAAAQPRASRAPALCSTGPGGLKIWVFLKLFALLNHPNGPGKGWSTQTSGVTPAVWVRQHEVPDVIVLVLRLWGQVAMNQVLLGPPDFLGTEREDSDSQRCPAGEH